MEKAFRKAPYPDVTVRERLAKTLGLNESRIQVKAYSSVSLLETGGFDLLEEAQCMNMKKAGLNPVI